MRYGELLRLANTLSADTGGSPRWVARNRAVSTAYYALFHAVAEVCARELVGAWSPWEPFRHIYRSLDHGHARKAFIELRGSGDFGEDAKKLANAFVELQGERHGADYDPGYRLSRKELKAVLASAEGACELVFRLPPKERRLLAARLIGRTRR